MNYVIPPDTASRKRLREFEQKLTESNMRVGDLIRLRDRTIRQLQDEERAQKLLIENYEDALEMLESSK